MDSLFIGSSNRYMRAVLEQAGAFAWLGDYLDPGLPTIATLLLGKLSPPELDPLSEKGLAYRIVSIAFLPEEVERGERLFDKGLEQASGDVTWVNRYADSDRFLDALTAAKAAAGVKNTGTAFGLLLDMGERRLMGISGACKETGDGATATMEAMG